MSSTAGKRGKRKPTTNEAQSIKVAVKKPRKKPKGMPDFKPGEILVDLLKKSWRLGDLIGWGGFGALYYASPETGKAVNNDDATYVAKVEPHSNGPLFGEIAFYQRAAKEETINKWISSHKLKYLGVPAYIGSGLHESNGAKYRFMIMERFGEDVDQIFAKCGKCFEIQTVLTLGIRIIDMLEYIHAQGYVHADLKGSNLMMGHKKPTKKDKVFLLDYGLACLYNPNGEHKEYKEDPKRRHDGTIEYTSRDAHQGVAPSRRSDLEILGYVMLHWLCGKLPWEDNLADKEYVMNSKIRSMNNIPQFLKTCLKDQKAEELEQYLRYVAALKYDQNPDYNKIKKIFQEGLRKRKVKDDGCTVKFQSAAQVNGAGSSADGGFQDLPDDNADSESPASPLRPAGKVSRKPVPQASNKDTSKPSTSSNKRTTGESANPTKPSARAVSPAKTSRGKRPKLKVSTSSESALDTIDEGTSGKRRTKRNLPTEMVDQPPEDKKPVKRGRGRAKNTVGQDRAKKTSKVLFVDKATSP